MKAEPMPMTVELPSGAELVFDSAEALNRAVASIKSHMPIVVRDEKDGSRQVVWAVDDGGC
jgi:hypothetical protein